MYIVKTSAKVCHFYVNLEASISLESQSSVEVFKVELVFFHIPLTLSKQKKANRVSK